MADALHIRRLYEQRWRHYLALADFERRAEVHRAAIAAAEEELSRLVLFVPPLTRRNPNPYFTPGELSRLCRAILRTRRGAFLAIDQITTGIMQAKGMRASDFELRKNITRMAQHALRRMWGRGSVTKHGHGRSARWSLA
jgi:hypothetical protein